LNISQAIEEIKKKTTHTPEISTLLTFLEESTELGIKRNAIEVEEEEEELIFPEIPEIGI
jgi:hypothetical protein